MKLRFTVSALVPVLAVALLAPAFAQDAQGNAQDWVTPRSENSRLGHGAQRYSLDTLFGALKVAPDQASAKAIEDHIWAIWVASGSDTCNLLMSRVKAATDDKDYDLAIKLLDAIVALKPGYVEAWNQRATVYYLRRDYAHSIADIGEVLAREPRHFGALSGLGMMLQEIGDDKDALEAYRKALAIDPHLDNIADTVKTLAEKVEGRAI